MSANKQLNPFLKFALDIGPLLLFFAANAQLGIFTATGVFMVAALTAVTVTYAITRHLAPMPMVTAVIVLVFGSLTLILHNDLFIKVKPTIIYVLFGGTLLGGLQGLRRCAADVRIRSAAISSDHKIPRGKIELAQCLFDFRLENANKVVSGDRTNQFVGNAAVAVDLKNLRHT